MRITSFASPFFLMKQVRGLFWKAINRLAKYLNIFVAFNSSVGIKHLNMSKLTHPGKWKGNVIEIDPKTLLLGPDFLKDRYTLINTPLSQSPHYSLVKCISEGGDIDKTDYYKRYINATLDWRLWQFPKFNLNRYSDIFKSSKDDILYGKYHPVIIYKIGNHNFIFDGKHRASMCLLLGRKVVCIEVENTVAWRGAFHFFFEIASRKRDYQKHISFIDEAKRS